MAEKKEVVQELELKDPVEEEHVKEDERRRW